MPRDMLRDGAAGRVKSIYNATSRHPFDTLVTGMARDGGLLVTFLSI